MKEEAWIETASGRRVYPFRLTPEMIYLDDVAHALSNKCRFTGHCSPFYSVAQHSVLVAMTMFNHGLKYAREGLMHDAAEYILPDVAAPIKPFLPEYLELEERVENVIAQRFGLVYKNYGWPGIVKHYDRRALMTEGRDLMTGSINWDAALQRYDPFDAKIVPMKPEEAKAAFIRTAVFLGVV